MKLKLAEIMEMKPTLEELVVQALPIRVAFKLNMLIEELNPILTTIEKTRVDLIKVYGEEDQEKQIIEVPKEKMEEFQKEINEFLKDDIEVNFEPIDLELMGDAKITPTALNSIIKLFNV